MNKTKAIKLLDLIAALDLVADAVLYLVLAWLGTTEGGARALRALEGLLDGLGTCVG